MGLDPGTLAARLTVAGITGRAAGWTFATFPRQPETEAAFAAAREYAASAAPTPPGVLLVGATGTGKTSLAVSIAQARIEAGDGNDLGWSWALGAIDSVRQGLGRRIPGPVWVESWGGLKARFRREKEAEVDEGLLLDDVCGASLLVLDEIGLGGFTEWREEILWMILSRVERGRRLVLTSNREPAGLVASIGERNADRLCDQKMFRVVGLRGQSLRQKGRRTT